MIGRRGGCVTSDSCIMVKLVDGRVKDQIIWKREAEIRLKSQ